MFYPPLRRDSDALKQQNCLEEAFGITSVSIRQLSQRSWAIALQTANALLGNHSFTQGRSPQSTEQQSLRRRTV